MKIYFQPRIQHFIQNNSFISYFFYYSPYEILFFIFDIFFVSWFVTLIYHGLHNGELWAVALCFRDEVHGIFRFFPVDAGDTDPLSAVRPLEAGNEGETWRGEGGGDGKGIITCGKGLMYCKVSLFDICIGWTVVFVVYPWQRDVICVNELLLSNDVNFLVRSGAHWANFVRHSRKLVTSRS